LRQRKNFNCWKYILDIHPKVPEQYEGWLEIKLSKPVMKKLWNYIETARKIPGTVNEQLAGNISESRNLEDKDDWFYQAVLSDLILQYKKSYPHYGMHIDLLEEQSTSYCLNSFWVNFQKENEFNPLHNHSGVFSFVIWVKIPTDYREQHAMPISVYSGSPSASNFEFRYTSMLGDLGYHSFFLDKESEGKMLFFPAKLMHTVYPFYSCSEERISISGNIAYDTQNS
jgi:hypothetical protein